jgi:oligoendopeptidase F
MTEQAKKSPERESLPQEMTWDLDVIYADLETWEKDFAAIDDKIAGVMHFKGRLGAAPEVLAAALESMDDMERLAEKVYVFAHLRSDENIGNSDNRALLDRVSIKFAELSGAMAWFEPEFLALDAIVHQEYLCSPDLGFYRRTIKEMLRSRAHTLSAKEERLLGLASDIFSAPQKTFSALNNADLKFPVIKDDTGAEVELTHGNYIKFLESGDREVRKNAFESLYDTFAGFRNTLATTLDATVKKHVFSAEVRNYPSVLEAALFSDHVPVKVYNNLISTVHSHLEPLHKYFALRARVMGLEKLDMYDIYNPLVADCRMELSWEEARNQVEHAVEPLGKEYCNVMRDAFEKRWIDVLECQGKRSGAYSSGCFDTPPYILMNFNGTLNDVFTLAHELGHSMHSWHSNHTQHYHYADYRIFVAEVASTTNELLLHHYLMEQNDDPSVKAYLLCHQLDQIRGTLYRQAMFAEFEKHIHVLAEQKVPLTPDLLCEDYYKLNAEYHGENVAPDQRVELEWARIPHFYYNFYVYKYATGISAAAKLSQNILSGDQTKLGNYIDFLKAGDSRDVLDIMRDAGVDLSTPEPIVAALKLFEETVDQLDGLL